MHGFWVSTEVFIDDVEGYLWGEGKKSGQKCPIRNSGIVSIGCATMFLSKMKQAT